MRKQILAIMSVLLFVISFGLPNSVNAATTVYNLANDFSLASNPNNVWTYGAYVKEGDANGSGSLDATKFTAFKEKVDLFGDLTYSPLQVWNKVDTYSAGDPNIIYNPGGSDVEPGSITGFITFRAGKVTFGPYLGPTVARWTAPRGGMFQIDAVFATVQGVNSGPNAYVYYNGAKVDGPRFVPEFPNTVGYNSPMLVAAGKNLDFVVWGDNGNNKTTEVSVTITVLKQVVAIDIKPGSEPNSINLCSNGAVPVAVLGSAELDVANINTTTLKFADAEIKVVGKKDRSLCTYEDVNEDGMTDLVCHFVTTDIEGVDGDSMSATVTGELLNGIFIEGTDSVNIVKDWCD